MQAPVHESKFRPMTLAAPPLTRLARRKAALVKHHGADDPRALAAAAELRLARLLHEIEAMEEAELAELLASLDVLRRPTLLIATELAAAGRG